MEAPMCRIESCIILLAFIAIGRPGFAQRNLTDVPTSDIVESGKVFVQEQAVFTKEATNVALTLTYGVGRNFEFGVSVYQLVFYRSDGLVIDPKKPDGNPDFLINAQKGFNLTDHVKLGIGTYSGINAFRSGQQLHFVNFNYLNGQLSLSSDNKIVSGVYYANDAYAGEGTNWGAMAGVEVSLVEDKLHLMTDFLSGNTSLSVFNAAIEISLPKEWSIAIGAQFPLPGGVLQISKN
jgi:hypothetical protein